jgi:DsbC/DsbD-like thiol-disulfide interchange protein
VNRFLLTRAAASCATAVLALASSVSGQVAATMPARVKVRLVASPAADRRSASVWLGLRFDLAEGWHIYWQNPGDSGAPPDVTWTLPTGVVVGPLRWPVPERIVIDTMVDYGYRGSTLALASMTAPVGGWPARSTVVTAHVKWMACRDICLPGKSDVSLELPARMASESGAGVGDEIRRALAKFPERAPSAWRVTGSAEKGSFTITIETGRRETTADFFPIDSGQVDSAAPVVATPRATGITMTLRKSPDLAKPIPSLRGVVVLGDGRAYEIAAKIGPSTSR